MNCRSVLLEKNMYAVRANIINKYICIYNKQNYIIRVTKNSLEQYYNKIKMTKTIYVHTCHPFIYMIWQFFTF